MKAKRLTSLIMIVFSYLKLHSHKSSYLMHTLLGYGILTKEQVQLLGLETEFTATEVAGAAQTLAQAGFSADDLRRSLIGVTLNLASASGEIIDLASAADVVATTFKVFGPQFDNDVMRAREIGDSLVRMTQITRLQFDDLQRAFAGVSGEARIFKQDFHEVLAMLGALFITPILN